MGEFNIRERGVKRLDAFKPQPVLQARPTLDGQTSA